MAARAAAVSANRNGRSTKPKFRDAVGQVARRLVAERQQAVFDQPQDIVGAVAEIHDVEDVFHVDPVAELARQPVADELERAAEAGAGRPVAAHADLDRGAHFSDPPIERKLSGTATPDAPIPRPMMTNIPPTPVAAATTPASAGNTTWPMRLPVIRNVSAVP